MELYKLRPFVSRDVWIRGQKIMGRVVQYRPGRLRISGYVLASEGEQFYSPTVASDGSFFCDCKGYEYGERICSHIVAMLRKAEFDGVDIKTYIGGLIGEYKGDEEMSYKTSIEGYNRLFGGLKGGRHISGLFALPETCKSYMNAQFVVDMAVMHQKSSLVIDTEGGFAPEWIELISRRFKTEIPVKFIDWKVKIIQDNEIIKPEFDYKNFGIEKYTSVEPTVYIYDVRNLVQIFPFFGRPQAFKIKSGVIEGIEFGKQVAIYDSPIGLLVNNCNIGYVSNDSLSNPIESFFTGGQMNYRTRTKATQVWLAKAQELIDEYKIVFMNTAHATIAHNNPYAVPQPVGGKAVLHNNKYIAYIEKWNGKRAAKKAGVDWHNLRRMSIYRHMTKGAWSEICYLLTTDSGVIDFYKEGEEPEEGETPLPQGVDEDTEEEI